MKNWVERVFTPNIHEVYEGEDQERDEDGKFASGGGGGSASKEDHAENARKASAEANNTNTRDTHLKAYTAHSVAAKNETDPKQQQWHRMIAQHHDKAAQKAPIEAKAKSGSKKTNTPRLDFQGARDTANNASEEANSATEQASHSDKQSHHEDAKAKHDEAAKWHAHAAKTAKSLGKNNTAAHHKQQAATHKMRSAQHAKFLGDTQESHKGIASIYEEDGDREYERDDDGKFSSGGGGGGAGAGDTDKRNLSPNGLSNEADTARTRAHSYSETASSPADHRLARNAHTEAMEKHDKAGKAHEEAGNFDQAKKHFGMAAEHESAAKSHNTKLNKMNAEEKSNQAHDASKKANASGDSKDHEKAAIAHGFAAAAASNQKDGVLEKRHLAIAGEHSEKATQYTGSTNVHDLNLADAHEIAGKQSVPKEHHTLVAQVYKKVAKEARKQGKDTLASSYELKAAQHNLVARGGDAKKILGSKKSLSLAHGAEEMSDFAHAEDDSTSHKRAFIAHRRAARAFTAEGNTTNAKHHKKMASFHKEKI